MKKGLYYCHFEFDFTQSLYEIKHDLGATTDYLLAIHLLASISKTFLIIESFFPDKAL